MPPLPPPQHIFTAPYRYRRYQIFKISNILLATVHPLVPKICHSLVNRLLWPRSIRVLFSMTTEHGADNYHG